MLELQNILNIKNKSFFFKYILDIKKKVVVFKSGISHLPQFIQMVSSIFDVLRLIDRMIINWKT